MRLLRALLLTLFLLGMMNGAQAQYKIQLPNKNDYTSAYLHNANKRDGFIINISAVAMFTAGVADRSGFRLGGGISAGYQLGDWSFTTGLDAYKAKEKFNFGTSYVGLGYKDKFGYGGSYYVTRYYQGDKQTSGIVSLMLDDFQIKFEDDILALPFTGFKIYDRFRTAALEVQYKHILLGTNVYTTDISGMTDVSKVNRKGIYKDGKQVSSPIYVGYTNKGLVARYGWNHRVGGIVGQNSWHRGLFDSPDFKHGDYSNQFIQLGVNKPYTLY